LASYAGLVPSVRQSGSTLQLGRITKAGSPQLRCVLVQAAHVLLFRCRSVEAQPLKAIAERVHTTRRRRKIAVVAAARHILRIAYYVLRDGTTYEPSKLASMSAPAVPAA
jgi:transposase